MGTCIPSPARLKQMLLLQLLLLHAPGMWVSKPPHRAEAFCIGIFSKPDITEPLGSGLHRLCSQREARARLSSGGSLQSGCPGSLAGPARSLLLSAASGTTCQQRTLVSTALPGAILLQTDST